MTNNRYYTPKQMHFPLFYWKKISVGLHTIKKVIRGGHRKLPNKDIIFLFYLKIIPSRPMSTNLKKKNEQERGVLKFDQISWPRSTYFLFLL